MGKHLVLEAMKIAFFQAALLIGAASASEAYEVEEASYWPDMLVQTASLVDYFFPNAENEPPATYLAEIASEQVEDADLAELEAEAEAELEAEADAELEGEDVNPAANPAVKAAVKA